MKIQNGPLSEEPIEYIVLMEPQYVKRLLKLRHPVSAATLATIIEIKGLINLFDKTFYSERQCTYKACHNPCVQFSINMKNGRAPWQFWCSKHRLDDNDATIYISTYRDALRYYEQRELPPSSIWVMISRMAHAKGAPLDLTRNQRIQFFADIGNHKNP